MNYLIDWLPPVSWSFKVDLTIDAVSGSSFILAHQFDNCLGLGGWSCSCFTWSFWCDIVSSEVRRSILPPAVASTCGRMWPHWGSILHIWSIPWVLGVLFSSTFTRVTSGRHYPYQNRLDANRSGSFLNQCHGLFQEGHFRFIDNNVAFVPLNRCR